MAELRVELPSVVALLAPSEVCERIEAPGGATLFRVGPREVMVVGRADVSGIRAAVGEGPLIDDVSDGWAAFVIEGADAHEAFARLSELEPPARGWMQGTVAGAAARVLVEPRRITILVPAMLAAHVEDRIRVDGAEVLAP
ncbi:MAG: hypothetical protein ABWZ53_09205 [Actinomycetota bacterium]